MLIPGRVYRYTQLTPLNLVSVADVVGSVGYPAFANSASHSEAFGL